MSQSLFYFEPLLVPKTLTANKSASKSLTPNTTLQGRQERVIQSRFANFRDVAQNFAPKDLPA